MIEVLHNIIVVIVSLCSFTCLIKHNFNMPYTVADQLTKMSLFQAVVRPYLM